MSEEYAGEVRKDLGLFCLYGNKHAPIMRRTRTLQTKGHLNNFRYIHVKNVPFLSRHGSSNSGNSFFFFVHFIYADFVYIGAHNTKKRGKFC